MLPISISNNAIEQEQEGMTKSSISTCIFGILAEIQDKRLSYSGLAGCSKS